jgi:hypothetical protein
VTTCDDLGRFVADTVLSTVVVVIEAMVETTETVGVVVQLYTIVTVDVGRGVDVLLSVGRGVVDFHTIGEEIGDSDVMLATSSSGFSPSVSNALGNDTVTEGLVVAGMTGALPVTGLRGGSVNRRFPSLSPSSRSAGIHRSPDFGEGTGTGNFRLRTVAAGGVARAETVDRVVVGRSLAPPLATVSNALCTSRCVVMK